MKTPNLITHKAAPKNRNFQPNMNRNKNKIQLKTKNFDICIIGAGASGAGCALDAALRGFNVALIDKDDFASETSSKSTKLIHGGVRYLEQAFKQLDFAQLTQVRHGLHERTFVLQNAPHLAKPLGLVTPVFSWFDALYYGIGLKIYDFFAKNNVLPKSQWLSYRKTLAQMPNLTNKIHSAVLYYDGQLDDARYCLALAQSAQEVGATVINHIEVVDFQKNEQGKIKSCIVKDVLNHETFEIKAQLFLNCTGAKSDTIRQMATPSVPKRLRPSKGVHLVLPADVLQSENALLIPQTADGRVVFVIPFEQGVLVGTTDDDYKDIEKEPILESQEIDFLLDTIAPYLNEKIDKCEIKSGFGGLRPLVTAAEKTTTKKLVRDHEIEHDPESGLLSLLGGKWTTYRLMAEETIDKVEALLRGRVGACQTKNYRLAGGENFDPKAWEKLLINSSLDIETAKHLNQKYGSRANKILEIIRENPLLGQKISDKSLVLKAEVIYSVRFEMACTIRDFMARRTRLEITDWQLSLEMTPSVGQLMATTLGWSAIETAQSIAVYQELIKKFMNNL